MIIDCIEKAGLKDFISKLDKKKIRLLEKKAHFSLEGKPKSSNSKRYVITQILILDEQQIL